MDIILSLIKEVKENFYDYDVELFAVNKKISTSDMATFAVMDYNKHADNKLGLGDVKHTVVRKQIYVRDD